MRFLEKNKSKNREYEYSWLDYRSVIENTFVILKVMRQTRKEESAALVVCNLMVDVILIDEIFNNNLSKKIDLQYEKYFSDIKKLDDFQLSQILIQKREYIEKNVMA